MTDGMQADYATLLSASTTWDSAADSLDGAWHRLHGTSGSPMDPGVVAAFEAFRERWVDEVKRVATAAQSHADTLGDAMKSYASVDEAAFARMRGILPFAYRDSTLDPNGAMFPTPTPGVMPEPPSTSSPAPATPSPSPGPSPTPSPTPTPGPTP